MNNDIINGGCVLLSRQILNSEIWRKPPEYLKIFLYILLKVNHKDELFERGSNFFNFSEQKPDGVTKNQIYDFLRWAKSKKIGILTTQKTTRGVVVKINNYDRYQNIENYKLQHELQNSSKTAPKQLQNNSNTINKNERMKECNNVISIEGKKNNQKKKKEKFKPPTLEEVKNYCKERKNNVDFQRFFDYYAVNNWRDKDGKPIINWKQKIIAVWEKKSNSKNSAAQKQSYSNSDNFYMSLSK